MASGYRIGQHTDLKSCLFCTKFYWTALIYRTSPNYSYNFFLTIRKMLSVKQLNKEHFFAFYLPQEHWKVSYVIFSAGHLSSYLNKGLLFFHCYRWSYVELEGGWWCVNYKPLQSSLKCDGRFPRQCHRLREFQVDKYSRMHAPWGQGITSMSPTWLFTFCV